MKINLKKLAEQRHVLNEVSSGASWISGTQMKKLRDLGRLLEEIDTDLGLCGESIIEIDKPRLEAIEERDKWLNFYNKADDI
jgi:hypothetical protein